MNFTSCMPYEIAAYLVNSDIIEEQRELNSIMLFTYYEKQKVLSNYISYIVSREITCRLENPDDVNTPLSSLLSCLFTSIGAYVFNKCSSSIAKKCSKIKNITVCLI